MYVCMCMYVCVYVCMYVHVWVLVAKWFGSLICPLDPWVMGSLADEYYCSNE